MADIHTDRHPASFNKNIIFRSEPDIEFNSDGSLKNIQLKVYKERLSKI